MNKNILTPRVVYKPFEYPEAHDYWLKQQQAHWLHTEVPMMSDLNDWNQNLTESEKNVIGSILKGFAQTETIVNDYWSGLVTKWFRKPEIIMMAVTAADTIKRTITGTIVTWNEQGNTSVGPTIFAADSIEIKPVKLLLEHDRTRPIGKMVSHLSMAQQM